MADVERDAVLAELVGEPGDAERRMADVGRLRGIWLGTMGSA